MYTALFISTIAYAQPASNWELAYPKPGDSVLTVHNRFMDVAFYDSLSGIVCAENGVLITSDAGYSWEYVELIEDTTAWHQLTGVEALDDKSAWTCGWDGLLFFTSNKGRTWEDRSMDSAYDMEDIFFLDDKRGWMVGDSSSNMRRVGKPCVFRTADGGQTWIPSSMFDGESSPSQIWPYLYKVSFVDARTGFVAGNSGLVAKSTDGGETWSSIFPPSPVSFHAVQAFTSERVIVGGEHSQLHESTDSGVSWIPMSVPNGVMIFRDIFLSDGNNGYAIGVGVCGAHRTIDNAETWEKGCLPDSTIYHNSMGGTSDGNGGAWLVERGGYIFRVGKNGTTRIRNEAKSGEPQILIYPSPLQAGEQYTMNIYARIVNQIEIMLYDISGRYHGLLYTGTTRGGSEIINGNVPMLIPGIYVMKLVTRGCEVSSRLLWIK
jgi:photosystem II stability/assembly factor-like uncharacterized protein